MMDGVLWNLDECGCKYMAYADDLMLIVKNRAECKLSERELNQSESLVNGASMLA